MASVNVIDVSKITRDLLVIQKRIDKAEDVATTRALNIILNKEEKRISAEISKEYGISQASVRAKIKKRKATKTNKLIALNFRSLRANVISPRQLKKGISFRKKGGGRIKITTRVTAGSSKPFMINAKAGGYTGGANIKVPGGNKKIPVYIGKRENPKRGPARKVTTMKGSSIPHMAAALQIQNNRLENAVRRDFPGEYRNQLKKARFTGRF